MKQSFLFSINVKEIEFSKQNPFWAHNELITATVLGLDLMKANNFGYDLANEDGSVKVECKSTKGCTNNLLPSVCKKSGTHKISAEHRANVMARLEALKPDYVATRLYKGVAYAKFLTYEEAKANGFKCKITVAEIKATW